MCLDALAHSWHTKIMANELTTYQAERNHTWMVFWGTLKAKHPQVLQELCNLTPSYKAISGSGKRPLLFVEDLWAHLTEDGHGDEFFLSIRPYMGVKVLELARSVIQWQAKYHLTGYWGFERVLSLLDTWSLSQRNWQDMPIYDDGNLLPFVRDWPKPPEYRPGKCPKNHLKEVDETMRQVNALAKKYEEFGPDLAFKNVSERSMLEIHLQWLVLYLYQGKSYGEIANGFRDKGGEQVSYMAVGKAVRESSVALGLELPKRVGRKKATFTDS
jgi:hypothetical protein